MKVFILLSVFILTGCGQQLAATSSGGTSGGAYCNVGQCYSYLEDVCCPNTAPYACNGGCYTYSGGGGCSSYKTQCY
jgi:hypothetical protein